MRHQKLLFAGALGFALACGTSTLEQGTPADDLAQTGQGLELKVKALFGPEARVGRIFGHGAEVLVGVALEPAVEDSDVPVPLAVASLERGAGALTVVSAAAAWQEARRVDGAIALVTAGGELRLREPDGTERTLAAGVKGELVDVPGAGLLFTAGDEAAAGETAVMLVGKDGALQLVADGAGVDDRGSVSPDGSTVVFVSGRTGVASLYRTTLGGNAAVQLTNLGLESGRSGADLQGDDAALVDDDVAPNGFVPPPFSADALSWVSDDVVRYDAGGGEFWRVDVHSGVATREGGAP